MKVFAFILLGLFNRAMANSDMYKGYKILRLAPKTDEAHRKFNMKKHDFQILNIHSKERDVYDVVLSPDQLEPFKFLMKEIDTEIYLISEDIPGLIEKEAKENKEAKKRASGHLGMAHTYYRDSDEINAALASIAETNRDFMSLSSIGQSYEGRNISVVKVSTDECNDKPVIIIDCGIHAREWITHATCLFFLDSLSHYDKDAEVKALLDAYDFHIITVANPDGYAYTKTDRLWRKNRVPTRDICIGVDLNRNFDIEFGGVGSSNDSCNDLFHGPFPFSENETQHLRDYMLDMKDRIKMHFSIHSFSQMWMYPYGFKYEAAVDDEELRRVAKIGVEALESVYGTKYTYGAISTTIYKCSGCFSDWSYDVADILYSYILELRGPPSSYAENFFLPVDQIEPTVRETWEGLKAAIRAVK